ncbi:MAG TPA: hypothetical protein DCL49_02070 [Candidatus Omnitrophica bacterium]|nr:hypothetical protein [Candidatus Omnitrophota bacterium]HBG64075.1 hypothetical protein [Candidatus Omnitrophota bacterium]HCD38390.1 hypothetical protein [Candidatus Omnitrophota bacterium]
MEVEGTHNFVPQGIVAHNTYVQKKPETRRNCRFGFRRAKRIRRH